MTIEKFRDMYLLELEEARSLEAIQAQSLPKMADAATSEPLKQAFRDHAEATRNHLETVEGIVKRLGGSPEAHRDQSMERMAKEAEKVAAMAESGPLRDAALVASAQRIEHYEMAVYGTLAAYARQLGLEEDCQLLRGILEQEKDSDDLLSDLAVGVLNPAGVEAEMR